MVETLLNVDWQPSLLRVETSKAHGDLQIPAFVKVLREVTQDDSYASGSIAKIGWTDYGGESSCVQPFVLKENHRSDV